MEYYEQVATFVMEQVSDPCRPKNIVTHKDDGLFFVTFEAIIQSLGVRNRNNRLYTENAIMESLAADHIQELIMNKSWCGEAGHPNSKEPSRIVTIDPKVTSHKINNYWKVGNMLHATIETLDDVNGFGRKFTNFILQGGEPAFSLRAMCPLLKKPDGSAICSKKGHIVTYDWVILPSHREAYRDKSKPINKMFGAMEGFGNTMDDDLVPVNESTLVDFLKEESKNIKLVSNIVEIATENMILTEDMKYAILSDGGNTVYVKIEDKIKYDVRRYMSGF